MQGPEDRTHQDKLERALVVSWSRTRAWHKDKVKLVVRAELVENGSRVDIQIHTADKAVLIDDQVKGLVIQDGHVEHEYTIDWTDKPFRPADRAFVATAILTGEKPISSPPSAALWVDLGPPLFSV